MFGKVYFVLKKFTDLFLHSKILLKYTRNGYRFYLPSFNVVGFVNNLANICLCINIILNVYKHTCRSLGTIKAAHVKPKIFMEKSLLIIDPIKSTFRMFCYISNFIFVYRGTAEEAAFHRGVISKIIQNESITG